MKSRLRCRVGTGRTEKVEEMIATEAGNPTRMGFHWKRNVDQPGQQRPPLELLSLWTRSWSNTGFDHVPDQEKKLFPWKIIPFCFSFDWISLSKTLLSKILFYWNHTNFIQNYQSRYKLNPDKEFYGGVSLPSHVINVNPKYLKPHFIPGEPHLVSLPSRVDLGANVSIADFFSLFTSKENLCLFVSKCQRSLEKVPWKHVWYRRVI